MGVELHFQRRQKGRKDIDHETVGGGQHLANVLIDDGVEDDRAQAVALGREVDLLDHGAGFLDRVDIGPGELVDGNVLELR